MRQPANSAGPATSTDRGRLAINPSALCRPDPFARLLTKADEKSGLLLAVISFAANALLGLIPGVAISLLCHRAGYDFLPIFDVRELPWTLFSGLGIAPMIWIVYARQPRWMLRVFEQLRDTGVLVATEKSFTLEDFVRQKVIKRLDIALFLLPAVATGVAAVAVAKLTPYFSGYPSFYGYPTACWLLNQVYHWALWVPLFLFIPAYMVGWIVIRQAVAIWSFGELYGHFHLVPKPFHSDRCNGLGAMGAYAIRCALVAVLFGAWLLGLITFPILCGEPVSLTHTTLIPLITYPVAVPALLVPPVWSTHVAMGRAKAKALEGVGGQIRKLLSETQYQWIAESMGLVQQLQETWELMDRSYRTWPFDMPQLKGFSIAAAIPWLSALGSALLQAYLGS